MRGVLIGGMMAGLLLLGAASLLAQPAGTPAPGTAPAHVNGGTLAPSASVAPTTGFLFKTLKVGDKAFNYVVYVPRSYDPATPTPAVVFLHGSGECGLDGQKHIAVGIGPSLLKYPERWPCIVIMPQKPEVKKQWEEFDGAVMEMLAQAKKEFKIDPERVSLTGLSQGGHGTWMIAARYPDIWCAIAPVCGYSQLTGQSGPECAVGVIVPKLKGVPAWVFHGDMDDVVPQGQSTVMVEALRIAGQVAVGGPVLKYTRYPGTRHNSWDKAYSEEELPQFLMTPRGKGQ